MSTDNPITTNKPFGYPVRPKLEENDFRDANGNDVIIPMKVVVSTHINPRSLTRKIATRRYTVQMVNYSEMRREEQALKNRKIKRHRAHQQKVSH